MKQQIDTLKNIKNEPYELPNNFYWSNCDLNNQNHINELYILLIENYVEDDNNTLRFAYSKEFLKWSLQPPNYIPEWHVCIKNKEELIGFISGTPITVATNNIKTKIAIINYLCIHKKFRNQRLTPILIKELTRRINLNNIWHSIYTSGFNLSEPVTSSRYYHRSLNFQKLIDIGFSRLRQNMSISKTLKLYNLPEKTENKGLRILEENDCPKVMKLLNEYLKKFKISQMFSENEFNHWFLPKNNVIYSYVVENDNKEITDFISFFYLPSIILSNNKYDTLHVAYSFYNVSTKTPLDQLMNDALIIAKNLNFDVFNALDIMDNKLIFQKLKFNLGSGNLNYYLHNMICSNIEPSDIGVTLL